jgi:hypothetical protein
MAKKARVVQINTNTEPTWDREYTQTDIHEAMSWYNSNKSDKDAAKYLGITDAAVAKRFLSLAWSLRMLSRGCKFSPLSENTINGMRTMLKERLTSIQAPDDEVFVDNVVSIQDRIENKINEIIGEMQGLVDNFGILGDVKKMNAYQWMTDNNVKSAHANKIAEYFTSKLVALEAGIKDPTLKEYYEGYDKKRLINLYTCYANIISDAHKIASNASVARKPRKKKPVSFDKMVKGLNFLQKFDDLKLQSVDPVKIPGATQLWVYNVKTRKLGVYTALDAAGLLVKGSAIKNYSIESSISKTLRKPEATLKIVTDGGKIVLRKALDNVNSKPSKLNGRINKDTILLRIV